MTHATYTINIGLNVTGGDNEFDTRNDRAILAVKLLRTRAKADLIRAQRVQAAYVADGEQVTEDTLVIEFDTDLPLSYLHDVLHLLSDVLEQDCVVLRDNQLFDGWLLGSNTEPYGGFNPEFFKTIDA
jgi:hypothetical protein